MSLTLKNSAFILLFSTKLFSQNVSIGPIIGLNYTKVSNNSASKFKAGFNGGLFVNYSTKTNFGFNGSILYSQLGGKVENSNNYINLNYIQIPVNLVYYFGKGMSQGSFRPKVFIGPYVGFLLDAKSPGFTNSQTLEQMNKNDFGANIGGGFNYALKSKVWLNMELKYGHGFTGVPKSALIGTYQNRALSLNAGVSFALGTYDKKTGKMKL